MATKIKPDVFKVMLEDKYLSLLAKGDIDVRYHSNKYSRSEVYLIYGWERVKVYQDTNLVYMTMGVTRIIISTRRESDSEDATTLAICLQMAAMKCNSWNEDSGKPCDEVLK